MQLIPVVVKHAKTNNTKVKYSGGLLNIKARCYVRRVQTNTNPLSTLLEMRKAS